MRAEVAHRVLVLAGAALFALVLALAIASIVRGPDERRLPQSVPAPGGGWFTALGGPYSFKRGQTSTACGYETGRRTRGLVHSVLPCGAKLTLSVNGKLVLTQVVERGTPGRDREFGVTKRLARELGLHTVQRIRWRFAGRA